MTRIALKSMMFRSDPEKYKKKKERAQTENKVTLNAMMPQMLLQIQHKRPVENSKELESSILESQQLSQDVISINDSNEKSSQNYIAPPELGRKYQLL